MVVDVSCRTGVLIFVFADKYLTSGGGSALATITEVISTDLAHGIPGQLNENLRTLSRYAELRLLIYTIQTKGQLLDKLEDNSVDMIASNFGMLISPDRIKAWNSAAGEGSTVRLRAPGRQVALSGEVAKPWRNELKVFTNLTFMFEFIENVAFVTTR
uniref:Uncharacterized protein n=1 Tax=Globisporangium ultimum (strain ATCC 200006 / CBS 805.95 / DAOM BR144) TaxID=431595 RepID=K3WBF5_GLOUD